MKILLLLILSVSLLGSCEKEEDTSAINEFSVLFQYEYKNMAWGFSHSGWFLDSKGKMRAYDLPIEWRGIDSLGYIAYDSLIFNYNQTDTLLGQVDLGILNKKSDLIEGTLNGELSEIDCHGADIGSMSLYCYFWDAEKKKCKRQLLSLTGDCEQINISSEAVQLVEYLNQNGK